MLLRIHTHKMLMLTHTHLLIQSLERSHTVYLALMKDEKYFIFYYYGS